jgi:hypothetical protein
MTVWIEKWNEASVAKQDSLIRIQVQLADAMNGDGGKRRSRNEKMRRYASLRFALRARRPRSVVPARKITGGAGDRAHFTGPQGGTMASRVRDD